MSKTDNYKLHQLQDAIKLSDGEITEKILNLLKNKFKLSRVIKWIKSKIDIDDVNDDKIKQKLEDEKITAKQLFKLIGDMNITIKDDDFNEIENFDVEKPKTSATEKKLLKSYGKTKFTQEQQEKYIFDYDTEFNPYEQELTEYLKSKGKNESIKLQPHQRRFLEAFFYANLRGAICFWGVGTGKTLGAVASTKMYLNIYPTHNVVFILPPALMNNMAGSLMDFGVDISDNRIKFYTYDGYYRHGIEAENSLVIIDEAHNFRTVIKGSEDKEGNINVSSNKKGYVVLTKAGKPCHKIMLMTGTPFVNSPYDIENLISFAEGKDPLNESEYGKLVSDKILRNDYFKYKISHYMDSGAGGYFPNVKYIYEPIIVKNEDDLKELQQRASIHNPFYINSRGLSEQLEGLKTNFILKKIKENPEYKTIIFSSFIEKGVQQMMQVLKENNIPYVRISGQETTQEKTMSVWRFSPEKAPPNVRDNLDPVKVLIITRAGAEGVDTSMVRQLFVISGQWNEALYEQIVARASRYKSHHALPEKERFVNVYKLFLCSQKEADEIKKFNDPNYDFLTTLNLIKDLKKEDNKLNKKKNYSLSALESSKKGSSERKELFESADFAKGRADYDRHKVISAFGINVSADCMLFLIQKSKIQVINEFVKELDKIPQVEKTISDIPHAKKIYDEILAKNIKDGKIMKYLVDMIKPLKAVVLQNFGKLDEEILDHKESIENVLKKYKDAEFKKKSKKLLALNQEFFTSDKDAKELIKMSGVENKYSSPLQVLEPTAGHGSLVKNLLKLYPNKDFRIDMVEYLKDNREVLQNIVDDAPLLLNLMKEGDFLKFYNSTTYDLILMNPPFHLRKSNRSDLIRDIWDIDFVKRAYAMLKVGGVLVAITSQKWMDDEHYKKWLESKNFIHLDRTQKWESAEGREDQKISALKITMMKITKTTDNLLETQELLGEHYFTHQKEFKPVEKRIPTIDEFNFTDIPLGRNKKNDNLKLLESIKIHNPKLLENVEEKKDTIDLPELNISVKKNLLDDVIRNMGETLKHYFDRLITKINKDVFDNKFFDKIYDEFRKSGISIYDFSKFLKESKIYKFIRELLKPYFNDIDAILYSGNSDSFKDVIIDYIEYKREHTRRK
jgi:hypothetical protein